MSYKPIALIWFGLAFVFFSTGQGPIGIVYLSVGLMYLTL